ncbi:single-stranded DNA-binding protein, mitochondrial-like [Vespa mandarinia]|uniref:single-stranded DNA-binding protein, mitochondrial-like n=1 Tax=Vespa mandarinia TaxID=7446 RepID=UPI0016173E67|nr:single-stranded DNA-binding protein, mitochondrial-like [Vespa mandarinia]
MFHKVISRVCIRTNQLNNTRFFSPTIETNTLEKTINQITLLGRVGGVPQERGTEKHPVVIFSVATHFNYKYENDEFIQKTDWHRICVFKPSLRQNVINYLKKGQRVLVNGRLTYGEFKDDEGNIKSSTAIIADDVIFFH